MNLKSLLHHARQRLAGASARLDAEILLAHALGKPRAYLYAWPEKTPDVNRAAVFQTLLERRLAGEPVAYITGRREFWSLDLAVDPAVLIPRPETELLVELALARFPPARPARIADLGTGSGAIALALAGERQRAQIVATDASAAALGLAGRNAAAAGLKNIEFRHGSWYEPLRGERFAAIVSNPPYLAAADPHLTRGDVRFEPAVALVAGTDGLDAIREIIAGAAAHLEPGGWLLLEHGYDQGAAVTELLRGHGFCLVGDHRDAAGLSRTSCARLGV